jgi:hypothetical protein
MVGPSGTPLGQGAWFPLMTDEEWRARVIGRAVSAGKQDPRDSEDVKAHGYVRKPADVNPVPLADLLRHMESHYNERQLRNDLDCVLSLCGSESDRAEVRRFARAKLAGKPYKAPDGVLSLSAVSCAQCGKSFTAARSTARFCSTSCRVKHRRRNSLSV